MEWGYIITLGILFMFNVMTLVFHYLEHKRWELERKDLINRIYAKSTGEYSLMIGSNPQSKPRGRDALYKMERARQAQDNVDKLNPKHNGTEV